MPTEVRDILDIDVFKSNETRIVAGREGLNRTIQRVNVFDCPISDDVVNKNIIKKGDFFVTSLFVVKDSIEDMIELIHILIDSGSSGICVINEYIHSFPEEIIQLANKNSFPIFLVDKDIPYGEIIKSIMELIIKDKEDTINEMRIEKILNADNNEDIIRIAYEINNNFMQNCVVFYLTDIGCMSNCNYIFENINNKATWSAVKYKDGILLIITDNEIDKLKNLSNNILDLIKAACSVYILGISSIHNNISHFKKAIVEAINSCYFSDILNKTIIRYEELEIYSLLLPIIHRAEMMEFYNRMSSPLKKYDKKFNTNLFDNAICFIECDGNYVETAKKMFQHKNTIRYRITKIKQILNMEEKDIEFFTQLSIMVKIHKVITNCQIQ